MALGDSEEIIDLEDYPLRHDSKPKPFNIRRNTTTSLSARNQQQAIHSLKGPIRVIRLCLLSILIPGFLIAAPLYIRYHMYSDQIYPLAISDMRLIDNRVSTTWCQRQHIRVNTTFNAFLLPETPKLVTEPKPLTMVRELKLRDDMKEYWGFYLLKGSSVTVSTCSRWPGASLTIIRGHKHLHECAYIGDDSSEEIDEMMQAIREGEYHTTNNQAPMVPAEKIDKKPMANNDSAAPRNSPRNMQRHRADVKFHDPRRVNESAVDDKNIKKKPLPQDDSDDDSSVDKKQMVNLLAQLSEKTQKLKSNHSNIMWVDHIHKYRNQSINVNEQYNLKFANNAKHRTKIESLNNSAKETHHLTSEEAFQKTLDLLRARGDRGKKILERLIQKYHLETDKTDNQTKPEKADNQTETEKIHADKPVLDKNRIQNQLLSDGKDKKKWNLESKEEKLIREKRDLILSLTKSFNHNNGSSEDLANEQDLIPDGIADHHEIINETTLNDRSNSEFWSSFSSSEEALLNCAGLILNLPLTPHMNCAADKTNNEALGVGSLPNTVTYIVPTNGYYFFVFNSENEVQENYLRIQFDLLKTMYNVTNYVSRCFNTSHECILNLQFFSNEKLVLELPVFSDDPSLWNKEFVVISECEPRTALYLICVIAVPLFILIFAFQ